MESREYYEQQLEKLDGVEISELQNLYKMRDEIVKDSKPEELAGDDRKKYDEIMRSLELISIKQHLRIIVMNYDGYKAATASPDRMEELSKMTRAVKTARTALRSPENIENATIKDPEVKQIRRLKESKREVGIRIVSPISAIITAKESDGKVKTELEYEADLPGALLSLDSIRYARAIGMDVNETEANAMEKRLEKIISSAMAKVDRYAEHHKENAAKQDNKKYKYIPSIDDKREYANRLKQLIEKHESYVETQDIEFDKSMEADAKKGVSASRDSKRLDIVKKFDKADEIAKGWREELTKLEEELAQEQTTVQEERKEFDVDSKLKKYNENKEKIARNAPQEIVKKAITEILNEHISAHKAVIASGRPVGDNYARQMQGWQDILNSLENEKLQNGDVLGNLQSGDKKSLILPLIEEIKAKIDKLYFAKFREENVQIEQEFNEAGLDINEVIAEKETEQEERKEFDVDSKLKKYNENKEKLDSNNVPRNVLKASITEILNEHINAHKAVIASGRPVGDNYARQMQGWQDIIDWLENEVNNNENIVNYVLSEDKKQLINPLMDEIRKKIDELYFAKFREENAQIEEEFKNAGLDINEVIAQRNQERTESQTQEEHQTETEQPETRPETDVQPKITQEIEENEQEQENNDKNGRSNAEIPNIDMNTEYKNLSFIDKFRAKRQAYILRNNRYPRFLQTIRLALPSRKYSELADLYISTGNIDTNNLKNPVLIDKVYEEHSDKTQSPSWELTEDQRRKANDRAFNDNHTNEQDDHTNDREEEGRG